MRRREFLGLVGGAAAWPLGARAQQAKGISRIGMLMGGAANDPLWQGRVATVTDTLARLGWIERQNLHIDIRFGEGNARQLRDLASNLVKLNPNVILAASGAAGRALQEATRSIPIVVAGAGPQEDTPSPLVKNISRPEGNVTGFPVLYPSIGGKWVELLHEVAPTVTRVGSLFNPDTGTGRASSSYGISIESAARVAGITTFDLNFHNTPELSSMITSFAAQPNSGTIVIPGAATSTRDSRQLILLLAARYQLPVVHWDKLYPTEGGLLSYGSDWIDLHRRAAEYVDRLLWGARINELPVQYPTKFNLVVNLRAAKVTGLTIPETFLVRADEVIE